MRPHSPPPPPTKGTGCTLSVCVWYEYLGPPHTERRDVTIIPFGNVERTSNRWAVNPPPWCLCLSSVVWYEYLLIWCCWSMNYNTERIGSRLTYTGANQYTAARRQEAVPQMIVRIINDSQLRKVYTPKITRLKTTSKMRDKTLFCRIISRRRQWLTGRHLES
jgi:hypothetical protein